MSTSTGRAAGPRARRAGRARLCLGLTVALLAALSWLPARAAEDPAWAQDFEDRLPGQAPTGWGGTWGQAGDDLLIVSNLRAVSGRQALLLDRTGDNAEMWGVTTVFPDATNGWLYLAFAFLVQGAGHDARFGFEVRERPPSNRRVTGLTFAASKLQLVPMSAGGGYVDQGRAGLGGFERDVWHRVELWLPASGGPERRVAGRLSRLAGPGTWEPVGPAVAVDATPPAPPAGYGQLMLVMAPGARGYRLFLDDLQAAPVKAAPVAAGD